MMPPHRPLTLGVHPTSRGFGWVAFDGPFSPYRWGIYTGVKGDKHLKNLRCLTRFEKLLDQLKPQTVVLEAYDQRGRSPRIKRLCQSIVTAANAAGLEVGVYKRSEVAACFSETGARSRYEIAAVVARQVPALRWRLPVPRKAWDSDDKRLALFSATALVLTQFALGAARFLDGLKGID